MGTLTYAPPFCTDPLQLRLDLAAFFRDLRTGLGGKPMPYVWVPELHKDGERFHVHYAMGSYVPRSLIGECWPHGIFDIRQIGDLPVGSDKVAEARRAAVYLSKYVGKAIDGQDNGKRPFGMHRYEVAQGFKPVCEQFLGRTANEVIDLASQRMQSAPSSVWNSDEDITWKGAPAVSVRWGR